MYAFGGEPAAMLREEARSVARLVTGACSGAITVESRDAAGNASTQVVTVTVPKHP